MMPCPRAAFAALLQRCAAERLGITRVELGTDQLDRLWACVTPQPMAAALALPAELGGGFLPWDTLVEAITVRETYFFRHPEQLELVREHVLREQRVSGAPLFRVWSAGCASGEEPYSLAMLCHQEGLLDRTHVLGTDVCQVALSSARSATYREWSLRGLPPAQTALHFERSGPLYRVREHLRRRVIFRTLNLTEPCYPNPADGTAGLSLICCRNVLMFLDHAVSQQVAARLYDALAPGGFLLSGPSDPSLSGSLAWDVLVSKAGLLYRKPSTLSARPRGSRVDLLRSRAEPVREPEPADSLPLAASALLAQPANDSTPSADPAAAVRSAWNAQGAAPALVRCTQELALAPDALELQYLRALLLWELGRHPEAVSGMRMVLYLDREQPVAHFGLAVLHERAGDAQAASRSYRNALACCEQLAPDAALPLGDGICASGLRAAAEQALARLATRKVSA